MPYIGKDPSTRVTECLQTERLQLEPITGHHAEDYFRVFRDDAIAKWCAGKPTRAEAQRDADEADRIWHSIGVHKWLVYERASGTVVGRGGLSVMRLDAHDGAIRSFLPPDAWADEGFGTEGSAPFARRWAEIGWALCGAYWGRGYAAEIGRAGLRFAFEELDLRAVVAFTERHNLRSRAVMERIGMSYAGGFLSTGLIEGLYGVHVGAPFALYVALRDTWLRKRIASRSCGTTRRSPRPSSPHAPSSSSARTSVALEKVSASQRGGYRYGALSSGQRALPPRKAGLKSRSRISSGPA